MPKLLTLAEVARRLSTTSAKVAEWAKAGVFPAPVALPDGEWRWAKRDVNAWMDSLKPSETESGPSESDSTRPLREHAEELPELATDILRFLATRTEWIFGREMIKQANMIADKDNGSWKRAIKSLVDNGLIASDRQKGYLITPSGRAFVTLDPDELRLSPNALCILQALAEADGWLNGPRLSIKALGEDKSRNGDFRRNIDKLKDAGLIETDKVLGYRITDRGREYLAANPE